MKENVHLGTYEMWYLNERLQANRLINYALCLSNRITNLITKRDSPLPVMFYGAFSPLDVLATAFFFVF